MLDQFQELTANANGDRLKQVLSALRHIASAEYADAAIELMNVIALSDSDDKFEDPVSNSALIAMDSLLKTVERINETKLFIAAFVGKIANQLGITSAPEINTAILTAQSFIDGGTDLSTSLRLGCGFLFDAKERTQ